MGEVIWKFFWFGMVVILCDVEDVGFGNSFEVCGECCEVVLDDIGFVGRWCYCILGCCYVLLLWYVEYVIIGGFY